MDHLIAPFPYLVAGLVFGLLIGATIGLIAGLRLERRWNAEMNLGPSAPSRRAARSPGLTPTEARAIYGNDPRDVRKVLYGEWVDAVNPAKERAARRYAENAGLVDTRPEAN